MRVNRTLFDLALVAVLALALFAARADALTITENTYAADGTTIASTTTYQTSDAFAVQVFKGIANPVYMAGGGAASSSQIVSFPDKAGNVFTLGPNGEVYRNALRLASASGTKMLAEKIVLFGNELFAKGKTDGKWWRWAGSATTNAWLAVPADFDPAVLK